MTAAARNPVFFITLLIFLAIGTVHNQFQMPTGYGFNNKDSRYFIKIKRILCDSNPKLVTLTHCSMKLERNTNGKYSVGLVFSAPEPKMNLLVSVFSRLSANIYRPSPFKQTMNLCEFIASKSRPSLVTMFVPTFFQIVDIPDCPFKGNIVLNFTVPNLNIDPILGVTGDHKLVLNVTRTSGAYLFSIGFEVYVKGAQMRITK